MSARRILICMHDFSRGGTERVAIGLAANWVAAGRDVTILCGSTEGGLRGTVDARVKVVALDPPVRRGFLSRFALARAMGGRLADLRPDVIFLPGNFHFLLAGALRRADSRAVIALKISNPPLPIAAPFARGLFRHFTRAVDGFAAMNAGLARELKVLLPGRNIVTLHDPVYVRPAVQSSRTGGCNILWIGRLEPQKDPTLALQIMKTMDGHLTMLGDGALREDVKRRITAMGLEKRVHLAGYVPEIESHLAAADALLITSRYEGGPAVAVEALAQGVPVVSTDCSFLLHDLITSSEAGRIIPSRDPGTIAAALAAVCVQPRAPERLRALAAPFAPEACAQAYLDWFDALAHHG
jgi:glycosyltransferase involved in cell wall biosynthesis